MTAPLPHELLNVTKVQFLIALTQNADKYIVVMVLQSVLLKKTWVHCLSALWGIARVVRKSFEVDGSNVKVSGQSRDILFKKRHLLKKQAE